MVQLFTHTFKSRPRLSLGAWSREAPPLPGCGSWLGSGVSVGLPKETCPGVSSLAGVASPFPARPAVPQARATRPLPLRGYPSQSPSCHISRGIWPSWILLYYVALVYGALLCPPELDIKEFFLPISAFIPTLSKPHLLLQHLGRFQSILSIFIIKMGLDQF